MPRIPPVDLDKLTDRQKQVAEKIAGGPRGNVRGPFKYLLHSPELADCVQALGAYVRYNCAVPWKLRELVILITARHWRAQYEWYAHEIEARKAGLADSIIESMRKGERPTFTEPGEEIVYDFATELYAHNRPSDAAFNRAKEFLGVSGVMDLAGLLGHYNLIAITLNSVGVDVPGGEKPLPD